MAAQDGPFGPTLWNETKPILISAIVDFTRAAVFWIGIEVVHWIQIIVLAHGWLPTIVHILDQIEEVIVLVTIVVFLLTTFVSFAWGAYRRLSREFK